jgi:hypothetical protein
MAFAQRFLIHRPELRPIPLPILVRAFMGLFFAYIMTDLLLGNQLAPEMKSRSLDDFVDIFLHGVINPASQEQPSNMEQ